MNADDAHIDRILEGATCKVVKYGFSEGLDYTAKNIKFVGSRNLLL